MTLVASLIGLFAYLMSNDNATRLLGFNWFKRLIIVAFLLLSVGLFMTFGSFWGNGFGVNCSEVHCSEVNGFRFNKTD